MKLSKLTAEELFQASWMLHGLPGVAIQKEYRFCQQRRWRVDFALIPLRISMAPVAIEIEGRGRHQSFYGFAKDCEKYNTLAALGWRLFRFPANVVAKNPDGVVEELVELISGRIPEETVLL